MNEPQDKKKDPSMEEIFASIRRVVTSDRSAVAQDGQELTEAVMVNDRNEIISLNPMAKYTSDVAAPEFEHDTGPAADTDHPDDAGRSQLALRAESNIKAAVDPALDSFMSSAPMSGMLKDWLDQNLPDLVEQRLKGLIRPLLKEWFDRNLPTMVDRIVRTEIERIVSTSAER